MSRLQRNLVDGIVFTKTRNDGEIGQLPERIQCDKMVDNSVPSSRYVSLRATMSCLEALGDLPEWNRWLNHNIFPVHSPVRGQDSDHFASLFGSRNFMAQQGVIKQFEEFGYSFMTSCRIRI